MSLIPADYVQFLEVRRQQLALREHERSPQYEKLLADLNASIAEWQDWRHRHPGPGTMAVLRAHARWIMPLIVSVQMTPLLFSAPWLFGVAVGMNIAAPVLGSFYDRGTLRITVRGIFKDRGVKRRV